MNEVLDEQIKKLKDKGLIFKDEKSAKKILLKENYYSLTDGYTDVFLSLKKKNHEFADETYFSELYGIYIFDRDLKNLLFSSIHTVESNMKSYIAYLLIDSYGNDNFLLKNIFNKENNLKYQKLIEQLNNNIARNYHENIDIRSKKISPLILIRFFTFGNMVALEQILKVEDKKKLAALTSIPWNDLGEYLRILNIVRNICAHGDILFNLKVYAKLKNNKYENHKISSVMMILKKLLNTNDYDYLWDRFQNLLICLKEKIDMISYNNVLETLGMNKEKEKSIHYQPNPILVNDVTLDKDIMDLAEKLAENAHDLWATRRIKEKWKYGTIRDDKEKTTPDLIPYRELSDSEKKYDIDSAIGTLKVIQKLGFKISKESE